MSCIQCNVILGKELFKLSKLDLTETMHTYFIRVTGVNPQTNTC